MNGRQIKNSIVLARALARERGTSLCMEILRRAVVAVVGEGALVDLDDVVLGAQALGARTKPYPQELST
jgi:hypothetical protein